MATTTTTPIRPSRSSGEISVSPSGNPASSVGEVEKQLQHAAAVAEEKVRVKREEAENYHLLAAEAVRDGNRQRTAF